jgi:prolipoprotein diacylglyceryl transferase
VAFLASIPSPSSGTLELGPLTIHMYGLMLLAGIAACIWITGRRWVARGGEWDLIFQLAVWGVAAGIVGARLYHLATSWDEVPDAWWGPFAIWKGGLGVWGGIALGVLVGAYIARRNGANVPLLLDCVAPGLLVAQAIGRLGNYFNQELYGAHTDLPWGLEVYQRFNPEDPDNLLNGVATGHIPLPESPVHPTFLYELIWNLLVALLVVWADRRWKLGHGRAFALYVAGYTVGRGWIEMMRTDTANHILGLRVNVWTSILLFLGAVAYFVVAARRGPREAPETLVSKDAAGPDEVPVAAEEPGAAEPAGSSEPSEAESAVADEPEPAKVAAEAPAEKPAEKALAEEPKKTDES